MADALNEKLAKGPDNVMEFTMERLLVSIAWDILSTFNNGIVPTARSGNSSENAVYLVVKPNRKQNYDNASAKMQNKDMAMFAY